MICCALFLRVENSFKAGARPPKVNPIPRSDISDVQRNCTYIDSPYLTNDEWPEHPELLWFLDSSYAPMAPHQRSSHGQLPKECMVKSLGPAVGFTKKQAHPNIHTALASGKKKKLGPLGMNLMKPKQSKRVSWSSDSEFPCLVSMGGLQPDSGGSATVRSEMGTHRSFCLPRGRGAHSAPEWRRVADLISLSVFLINWTVIRREKNKIDTVIHHFLGNQTLAESMATEPIWTYHT